MKLKIKMMMLAALAVVCDTSVWANDASWTSTVNPTSTANIPKWNIAGNWLDGYIGGTNAANADAINFAYPFTTGTKNEGQPIDMSDLAPSFHSVTGLPFQVITRSGVYSKTVTVVDPSAFRGVWAQNGMADCSYVVNPESGETAEFKRVANGVNPRFNVASGGTARIRDLLGCGSMDLTGTGELILNTPRSLGTRAIIHSAGTLTVESPDEPEYPAPAAGASWRFDASATHTLKTVEVDGRTYVTNWCDANGGEAMAYASLEACRPFISPITVNGHHLVDFGGYKTQGGVYDPSGADELYGPAAYLLIGKTNNLSVATALGNSVCEMFVVMQAHAELSNNFFVSPLGNNSGYQIPMTFLPDTMFRSDYSRTTYGGYSNTKSEGDYRAWLDGEPYIGTGLNAPAVKPVARWEPAKLHVIAVNFKDGARPNLYALGTTRKDNGTECGGFAMAEAIIYKTELTDAERRQTIEYLKRKWLSGTAAKPYDMDAVIVGDASAKVNVESGNTAKIRTLRLGASIASSANVVKTGDGTLEVEEVLPSSATLEVRGGGVMLSHDTPVASTDRANVPTDGMLCWLDATSDASKFESDADGITKWKDCRDGYSDTVFAETYVPAGGTTKPTLVDDVVSGKKAVDYGETRDANGPCSKITINGSVLSDVREAFVVWRRTVSNQCAGSLFGGSRYGGYLNNFSDRVMAHDQNFGAAAGALWVVDGRPIDSTSGTIMDFKDVGNGAFAVINASTKWGMPWCYPALSGNSTNQVYRGGGCVIGEIITYSRRLSDAERRNVTAYLMNKWENGATLGLDTDDTVAKIAFTGGAAPKVGTRTDRTVTAIEGTGTLTKTGAGKLTVGSLDSGITVLDIKEGEIKCGSIANVAEISTYLSATGGVGTVFLGSAATLPASMTVNVAIDPEFDGKADYPIVKAESYASTPDISGWTLNVTGVAGGEFRLVRSPDGICLRSGVRGMIIIFR